jgi:hypothetical protein
MNDEPTWANPDTLLVRLKEIVDEGHNWELAQYLVDELLKWRPQTMGRI